MAEVDKQLVFRDIKARDVIVAFPKINREYKDDPIKNDAYIAWEILENRDLFDNSVDKFVEHIENLAPKYYQIFRNEIIKLIREATNLGEAIERNEGLKKKVSIKSFLLSVGVLTTFVVGLIHSGIYVVRGLQYLIASI